MDDERTKEALDALADLFLTGITSQTSVASQVDAPARDDDPLGGPAPIRLKPKVAVAGNLEPMSGPANDQEMLAAVTASHRSEPVISQTEAPFLRLADVDLPKQQRPSSPVSSQSQSVTVMVEAVLLGNLPGVSGPWLQQYAQLIANQDGPVAVLHVGGERIDVELIEPSGIADKTHPAIEMTQSGDRPAVVSLLDSLVHRSHEPVSSILVHVEPAVDGTEALRLFAIDDWTLLCGADDAAVVGAYRMLKQRTEVDVTVAEKRVGLFIMGSDEPASRTAAARIKSTADSFLHTPVELIGWQKQMAPVHGRQLGTFEGASLIWPKLCDFFASLDPPSFERPAPPPPEVFPKVAQTSQPVDEETPEAAPEPAPVVVEPILRVERPPSVPPSPRRAAKVMDVAIPNPAPQPRDTPPPQASSLKPQASSPPSLSSLITTLPGSITLEARCPHHPKTELVIDQAGTLHLLLQQRSADTDFEQAMTQLLSVRQWVEEHRALLALTQRQLKLDEQADVVLHLFTDQPEQVTHIVARLGDQVKLHLLQEITVGDQTIWFAAPLS